MSKEFYRKRLITLRTSLAKEREAKKKDNQRYLRLIKATSSVSLKASYRRSKVSASASHVRKIESLKKQIASARESLKRAK